MKNLPFLTSVLLILLAFVLFYVHIVHRIRFAKQHTINRKVQVTIIVVAGGGGPLYDFYRLIWHLKAQKAQGVAIYLVSYDAKMTDENGIFLANQSMLKFPGVDSIVPGCLETTFLAWEKIQRDYLPGFDAPIWLRTNLSTFWNLMHLLTFIQRQDMQTTGWLYAGVSYMTIADHFIPGGYLFLNRASMLLLLKNKQEMLDMKLVDDVAIGRWVKKNGLHLTYNLAVCIVENPTMADQVLSKSKCLEDFIFRVKTGNALKDIELWFWLFKTHYAAYTI